jgi:hypothetical protein
MGYQPYMGYVNAADKQAAYRQRKKEREQRNFKSVAAVYTLAGVLRQAADLGMPDALDCYNDDDARLVEEFTTALYQRVQREVAGMETMRRYIEADKDDDAFLCNGHVTEPAPSAPKRRSRAKTK